MTETHERPSIRRRLAARIFGGASGGVFRGMVTLALGSGIGRAIGIAAIPVLTRLYTPEDFGVLAVFTALVAILAPLVTLRYVLALPLPRHDGVAMNLLAVSTGLMLGLSALVALALWLGGETLLKLMSMQALAPWWWLIAGGVLGTATYESLTFWATRRRAYKVIAQTNVTQSAAGAVVKVGLGLLSMQPLGLLVGQVIAQAGGTGRLMRSFLAEFRINWRYISRSRMRKVAWRHRGMPIWRLPSRFLMMYTEKAPIFFISAAFGASISGLYAMATMILIMPVTLLSQTTSQAFYAELSRSDVTRSMVEKHRISMEVMKKFLALGALLVLLTWVFADIAVVNILGDHWAGAAIYMKIMSIPYALRLVYGPISTIFTVLEMHKFYLILNVQRAVLITLAFIISFTQGFSSVIAIALYAAVISLHFLASMALAVIYIKRKIRV